MLLPLLLFSLAAGGGMFRLGAQTTAPLKASPAALSFSYQEGDAKLPVAQTLALSGVVGTGVVVSLSGGPWLAASPLSATLPASPKVLVNPTSLTVGTYTGTISVSTTGTTSQAVAVPVTLVVKAAPSSLTASASSVAINHVRGGPAPAPTTLNLTSSGAVLSYSASSAGGSWLTVSPKSGIAFPSFPGTLTLTVNPAGLPPGPYKATITIAAPQATNKSQTITVNLTVGPGLPVLSTIWPPRVTEGAAATTVTLTGANFFSGSVVKSGTATLVSTVLGDSAATAVIPAELMATFGALGVVVSNPGTGGGDSQSLSLVVDAATPMVAAVLNGASFVDGPVAPGEMVTLFGSRLGPDTLTSFVAPAPGSGIATTLAGTTVYFDGTPAPILFTSARQVAVMAPYDVVGKTITQISVDFGGSLSSVVARSVAASAPGLFTAAGAGTGQLAAFVVDEATGAFTLNSETTTAAKGGIIVFYATGEGIPTPASSDGRIVTTASPAPNPALSLQIGGATATVLYAGGVTGLVSGIIQINARIPATITPSKATPVVLTVNGVASPAGTTIGIK